MFDFTKSKMKNGNSAARTYADVLDRRKEVCRYFDLQKEKYAKQGVGYAYAVMELTATEEICLKKPDRITMDMLREVMAVKDRFVVGQLQDESHIVFDIYDGTEPEGIIHVDEDTRTVIPVDDLKQLNQTEKQDTVRQPMSKRELTREWMRAERDDGEYHVPRGPKVRVLSVLDPSTLPIEPDEGDYGA